MLCLSQDCFLYIICQLRGAGHDPEVGFVAAANKGPLVGGVQEHDAVVTVEGAEEGDTKDARVVREFGFAFGFAGFAVLDTGVQDGYFAVFAHAVAGFAVGEATLETVVETGNLIPVAQVFVQLKGAGYAVIYFGLAVAGQEAAKAHNGGEESSFHICQSFVSLV